MPSITDKKLLRTIKFLPVAVTLIFMAIILIVVFSENHNRTEQLSQSLRNDFLYTHKQTLKRQIENIAQNLNFEKSLTIDILKEDIKEHVRVAHAIVTQIYEANADKSREDIAKLIIQALNDLVFNDGASYFFIFQMDGINVMHPMVPELQGQSLWNSRTESGRYDIREHIQLIENSPNQAAYYRWWHREPKGADYGVEKIRYGQYFEPLNWFIGTEEYITPININIVNKVLTRLAEFRIGQNSFVYVLGANGKLLVHRDKVKVGEVNKALYNHFQKNIIQSKEGNSAFVTYEDIRLPSLMRTLDKLSYVKSVPSWGWVIGTDLYFSEIDKLVIAGSI